jgi:hypothetical protein
MSAAKVHAVVAPALLALVLLAAPPAGARAAKSEVRPAEETFTLFLQHTRPGSRPNGEGTHVLSLQVYPLRGVAVAHTQSNNYDIENNDSVAYAEQIPKGPFDGYLDLHFKGLGSFVGQFVPHETSLEREAKGCDGPRGIFQMGDLVGSIEFHGGGYPRWTASRARGFLKRSPRLHCRPGAAERERRPTSLFGYVGGAPGSFNGWRYSLRARLRRSARLTDLAVFGYAPNRPVVNFDAATFEWLPGVIAVGRFVNRSVRTGAHLEVSPGGYHPEHATLRPPPPFSGVGTYTRATHRLTGTLAIGFPGLKLRVGGRHTVANLLDEDALREKSPNESFALDRQVAPRRASLPGAISARASAVGAPPDGEAKEVRIIVPSPTDHHNVLELHLFPAKGVAAVATYEGSTNGGPERSVSYAIAIPSAPFDDSLDLKFPGLGSVVGTVTPDAPQTSAGWAKLCRVSYPSEGATFEGHLDFRGAGGYGKWQATEAPVEVVLACGAKPKKENGSRALFGHVSELGPVLNGPAPIRLFAQGEVRHRVIEFIVWAGRDSNSEFLGIDREWLRGGVAIERWVKKAAALRKETLTLGPDSAGPAASAVPVSATFTPPAPFFGKATYRRSTGKLTGSLGVNFLGLKLHLAPSPLTATLADEDLG